MKKKRKLSPKEYLTYQKQHDYEDFIAAEEAKVRVEQESYVQCQRKRKQELKQRIDSLTKSHSLNSFEDDLEIPDQELIANRIIRNARTHKNRLFGLKDYEE